MEFITLKMAEKGEAKRKLVQSPVVAIDYCYSNSIVEPYAAQVALKSRMTERSAPEV